MSDKLRLNMWSVTVSELEIKVNSVGFWLKWILSCMMCCIKIATEFNGMLLKDIWPLFQQKDYEHRAHNEKQEKTEIVYET